MVWFLELNDHEKIKITKDSRYRGLKTLILWLGHETFNISMVINGWGIKVQLYNLITLHFKFQHSASSLHYYQIKFVLFIELLPVETPDDDWHLPSVVVSYCWAVNTKFTDYQSVQHYKSIICTCKEKFCKKRIGLKKNSWETA